MPDLYMQPAEMAAYQATPDGGTPEQLATAKLQSQMAEGNYFSERDHLTCLSVKDYVRNCNAGLAAYTNTAHTSANLYVDTDQSLAGEFNYLSDVEYSVRDFDVAYTSGGEWPVRVPGPMRIDAPGMGD